MATTREKIDSRGRSLLELLTANQGEMANLMNPSSRDQNTYVGPITDDPVDIFYPRSSSPLGSDVNDYTAYYLREFNLDGLGTRHFGAGRGTYAGSNGILTQAEHDRAGNENAALEGSTVDRFAGKQHDEPFRPNERFEDKRNNFMELKGRKSLLTLYWEMRGAFVDNENRGKFAAQGSDGQDKTFTNRYAEDLNSTGTNGPYDSTFYINTGEIYFPPSGEFSMMGSAANGFNLGQPLGPDISVITHLIERGQNSARDFFEREAAAASNYGLAQNFLRLAGQIIGPPTRVSQLFRPGWERNNLPRREVQPLTEVLEQNLLLPPNTGILDVGGANDTEGSMSSTFGEMYLRNRAARGGQDKRFVKGIIAGTGINDLQEPLKSYPEGEVISSGGSSTNPQVDVPFTYADDAYYLSHDKRKDGFISNGRNTQRNPGSMESAVTDFHRSTTPYGEYRQGTYRSNAQEMVGITDGQYFPFSFSTVNKKNSRMQLCTLQATLQSLGESYTPTWQSKHFFGRSEQVHTYTFTDRTIDLSFVIFADSMRQLQNVYERVLWLAQQCYPDYSSEDRIGSGPIIAIRIGDLFQYKAGFIRSLSYDWSFLGPGGKWELTRGIKMPQACNVTMSYQIIHEKVPSRDYNFYGGPAGGLSKGMETKQTISYGTSETDATTELDIFQRTEIGGNRFVPTHTLLNAAHPQGADYGEVGYLDHVDATNEALFARKDIPDQNAIDAFTGDRSAT